MNSVYKLMRMLYPLQKIIGKPFNTYAGASQVALVVEKPAFL